MGLRCTYCRRRWAGKDEHKAQKHKCARKGDSFTREFWLALVLISSFFILILLTMR